MTSRFAARPCTVRIAATCCAFGWILAQPHSRSSPTGLRKGYRRGMNESVVIGGVAVAKGRPRVTRRGFVYTPAATRKYEAYARIAASIAMNGRVPVQGPVRLDL